MSTIFDAFEVFKLLNIIATYFDLANLLLKRSPLIFQSNKERSKFRKKSIALLYCLDTILNNEKDETFTLSGYAMSLINSAYSTVIRVFY